MKKTKRRIITVLCTAFACAFALGFSACEEDAATPPPTDPPAQQTPEEEESGQAEIPLDKINEFIASLANDNYSFKKQIDGQTVAHYVDGNDLYIKVSDDEKYFYTYENGQMYYFEYNQNEESWVKAKSTTLTNFDSLIYDVLNATEWKSYDKATNTVTGTCGSVEYSLNLTNGKFTGGIVGEIYNVDDTSVIIPTTYIDKTIEIDPTPSDPEEPTDPEAPTDPVDPPVEESENIYEIIGGEYVFDVVALKEVLLNWMQGDNQFGKDVYAEKKLGEYITEDIIFVSASKENIEIACIFSGSENKYFQKCCLSDSSLYTNISNGSIKTKEEFNTYLNSILIKNFKYTEADIQLDTTISATDFETLTENTFARLEEKGTQGSSINNDFPETKLENFSDAEVLYGFKTKNSDTLAGLDLGYQQQWHQYYVLKYNNNIEFVDFHLAGSKTRGVADALENVLQNNENAWMIGIVNREDIDDNNAELYNEAEVQTMSYNPEIDILLNKKDREFF